MANRLSSQGIAETVPPFADKLTEGRRWPMWPSPSLPDKRRLGLETELVASLGGEFGDQA